MALILAITGSHPVYIFDEPGSDLDSEFRQFFYRNLLPDIKEQGKTIIVMTHDDNYFDAADRIIKLRKGVVISDTVLQ